MLVFSAICIGVGMGLFTYACTTKIFVKRAEMLKWIEVCSSLNHKVSDIALAQKVIDHTNRFLGHNDIELSKRIEKLEKKYEESCSEKIEEAVCGSIPAHTEEHVASDQASL